MDISYSNIINTIFYLGSIQGLILTFFLFNVKVNRISNRLLGTLTFLWAVLFLVFALQSHGIYVHYPHLLMTFTPLLFAWFPLLFLTVKYLVSKHQKFSKKDLLHFLPMLFNILMFSGFYIKSGEEKIRIIRLHEGYYHIVTIISEQILSVQGIAYSILSLIVIKNYKRNIVDYHSNINSTVLSGFRTGILLALIAWIIGIVGANLERLEIDLGIDLFLFVYMIFVVIIYLLSILVIRSPEVFKLTTRQVMPFSGQKEILTNEIAFTPNVHVRKESNHQILAEEIVDEDAELNKHLVEYMIIHKPYLNPDLNLQEMADELNLTRHQLSAIINQQQKMNFNEFVNLYRVEEAKKLMDDPKNINRKNYDLAFSSGFNSNASFYRIFKQLTNQTPSQYRSKALQ